MARLSTARSDYARPGLEKSFLQSRKYLNNARKFRNTSPDVTQRHSQHFQHMRATAHPWSPAKGEYPPGSSTLPAEATAR